MVSWYPKKSKFVLLVLTLHHDSPLEPDDNPEIIWQRQELMPLTRKFGIILLIEKQTDGLWQCFITLLTLHHTMLMFCTKSDYPRLVKKVFAEKDLNFYLRDEPPKKKRCYVCHWKSDKKIKQIYDLWKRNVCNDHFEKIRSLNTCKE